MAAITPLKELINNSTLSDMSKTLDKDPFPKVKIGFKHFHRAFSFFQPFIFSIVLENCEYSTNCEKLHEAGYDAYLTGICFIRMMNYLRSLGSSKDNVFDYYSNKSVFLINNWLTFHLNTRLHFRLFLMKNYDLAYIDLKANQGKYLWIKCYDVYLQSLNWIAEFRRTQTRKRFLCRISRAMGNTRHLWLIQSIRKCVHFLDQRFFRFCSCSKRR